MWNLLSNCSFTQDETRCFYLLPNFSFKLGKLGTTFYFEWELILTSQHWTYQIFNIQQSRIIIPIRYEFNITKCSVSLRLNGNFCYRLSTVQPQNTFCFWNEVSKRVIIFSNDIHSLLYYFWTDMMQRISQEGEISLMGVCFDWSTRSNINDWSSLFRLPAQ